MTKRKGSLIPGIIFYVTLLGFSFGGGVLFQQDRIEKRVIYTASTAERLEDRMGSIEAEVDFLRNLVEAYRKAFKDVNNGKH